MTVTGLVRTQYWNLSGPNPTPITGETSRAESRTDVEGHLLASDAARNAALHGWGVAVGLTVSAVAGTAGVTVAPGVALDLDGHVMVLGEGGTAIVDPLVGPTGMQNIPTVPVTETGVVLDTTGLVGDLLLTITWREVEDVMSGLLVLRQAPWLRLVDPTTFLEDGVQLVLAAVTIGTGGVVDGLELGSRRLVGVTAGRLELSLPSLDPATGAVGQTVSGRLEPRADGGMELNLLSPAGVTRRALSVDGDTGGIQLDGTLRVEGFTLLDSARVNSNLTVQGTTTMGDHAVVEASLRVADDLRAGSTTLAALTVSGGLVVQGATTMEDDVQIEANLTIDGSVTAEQASLDQLGVNGNVVVDGRLGVKTTPAANIDLQVNGMICATVFCNPSDARLKTGIADVGDVLDRLAEVRPVTFVPTGGEPGTGRRHAGVLAQDVVRTFPELVVPMGPDGLMAVDYAGLAGVLVGAVNELRAANAVLACRVAELDRRESDDDRRG